MIGSYVKELKRCLQVFADVPDMGWKGICHAEIERAQCWLAQPDETSVALTKCPYCERPADSEGGINHQGGCIGLEKIDLNRLQYNALVSRAFAPETPAKPLCSKCGGHQTSTDAGNKQCDACGGTGFALKASVTTTEKNDGT